MKIKNSHWAIVYGGVHPVNISKDCEWVELKNRYAAPLRKEDLFDSEEKAVAEFARRRKS